MRLFRRASERESGLAAAYRPLPVLLSLMLLVQTCALPIPAAFLLISADAAAVTEGCDTKTCCTALCYLDRHGTHHCVHKHGDACGKGEDPDRTDVIPVLLLTLALCPEAELPPPALDPVGVVYSDRLLFASHHPPIPIPPPQ